MFSFGGSRTVAEWVSGDDLTAWTHAWAHRCTIGQMDVPMDRWVEQVCEWMDGRMNGQLDGQRE